MKRSMRIAVPVALVLVACQGDGGAVLEPGEALFSKGKGGGGGGGQVVYTYSMSGDIVSPQDGPSTAMKAGDPFTNLSLSDFVVELGSPSGTVELCRTGSGEYADDFGLHANGAWQGTLKIARQSNTLSFLGSNTAGDQIQFSIGDATGGPVLTATGGGAYQYEYSDARLFFGSNSTHFDGKYRCVNVVLTAVPPA
jgi:hypothetical protein